MTRIIKEISDIDIFFKNLNSPISIVGNATSLLNSNYGSLIDNNFVIRFNYGLNFTPNAQGRKTDVLCINSDKPIIFWSGHKKLTFNTVISMLAAKKPALKKNQIVSIEKLVNKHNIKDLIILPESNVHILFEKLGKKPSSGLSLLFLLDQIEIKNINIFGFDFNTTKTFYNDKKIHEDLNLNFKRKDKKIIPHNFDKEKDIISSLIQKNNWRYYE